MSDRKQHQYLKALLIKEGLEAFEKELRNYSIIPEILFGLVAFYIEYRIDTIDNITPILEKYSDILIPELPKLVDNANFDFLNWDVWLDPLKAKQLEVHVTDPLGSSIKSYMWFLIISIMKGFKQINSPKSLEIREKAFLEALEFISSKKSLDKDLIRDVENIIKRWTFERKNNFWNDLDQKPIDEKRENNFKQQVKDGFNRTIFPESLLKSIIKDEPKFDYRKFDLIINVPKTLLVDKASDFTEYGIFGAGRSFGESIARGIKKYILDQIRQIEPESASIDEIKQKVIQGDRVVCNIRIWRNLVTDFTLKKIPVIKDLDEVSLDKFKDNLFPERELEVREILIVPENLGLLIKKSELEVSRYKESHRDSKTNEPMVLFRIKIVFSYQKNINVNLFRIYD